MPSAGPHGPSREAKIDAKSDPKKEDNLHPEKSLSRSFLGPFSSLICPSFRPRGSIFLPNFGPGGEYSSTRNIQRSAKRNIQRERKKSVFEKSGTTESDTPGRLRARADFGSQVGAENRAKIDPKRHRKKGCKKEGHLDA